MTVALLAVAASPVHADTWDVERLLAAPTAEELAAVEATWAARDLAPEDVQLAWKGEIDTGPMTYDVSVLAHRIEGNLHYGAVFVPRRRTSAPLPVIVDIRGVRWDYPTRNLSQGPFAAQVMGRAQGRYIFAVPCLRGHNIELAGELFRAEGDRRDSWDGATDDAIAFLSVVLAEVPEADPDRVVSFGGSRGATVAMLHGIRDDRVSAVVALSGPTDWLALMGRPGQPWAEALATALADPELSAQKREHQFIEWFLEDRSPDAIAAARARLIASSPLHFAARLPAIQLHHGRQDRAVPVANAIAMKERWDELGLAAPDHECVLHDDAGHDLSRTTAARRIRRFLTARLTRKAETSAP